MPARIPDEILRAYALPNARAVDEFESYGNDNWLVEEARGRRYVLRCHHLNADPARIEFQLDLQQHIAAQGIPTTSVVRRASGERIAFDEGGTPWVLFDVIEGDEYDFSRLEQAVDAARTLARFHLATETFVAEAAGPEYKAPFRDCWENAERDLRELEAMFTPDAAGDLACLAECWNDTLAALPPDHLAALPAGWIHGDYHGRNLVFDGDSVAGVFDFDDVDRGPYACDLAGAVLKFARVSRGSVHLRPDVARIFVEAYAAVRPLTPPERAALPVLLPIGHPPHPRSFRYWRRRGDDITARFGREVAGIRRVRAQLAQLAPASLDFRES
jgi:Ser/Thr protein kinase RdoA (MazF antagonist)